MGNEMPVEVRAMPKDKVETQGVSQYEPSDAERKALRRQIRRKKKQTPAPRLNIVRSDYREPESSAIIRIRPIANSLPDGGSRDC